MAVVRRSRRLPVAPSEVWRTVGDPHQLPRWWPRVQRVEQVSGGRFTEVLETDRGRSVRADFRITQLDRPRAVRWIQELEGGPFERVFAEVSVAIRLTPDGDGTEVEIELTQRMRGVARFGDVMVRRAASKQIRGALAALEELHA